MEQLGRREISWAWTRPALTQGDNYLTLQRRHHVAGTCRYKASAAGAGARSASDQERFRGDDPSAGRELHQQLADYFGAAERIGRPWTGVQVAISTGAAAFTNFFWNGATWQAWTDAPLVQRRADGPSVLRFGKRSVEPDGGVDADAGQWSDLQGPGAIHRRGGAVEHDCEHDVYL